MTRLFLEDKDSQTGFITLNPEDSHYIAQVLRMRQGEQLTVVLNGRIEALCEVDELSKSEVKLKILKTGQNSTEPLADITLYQSVSKGERMDLTIQKCVELGVTRIVPVFSSRCVVRPDDPKKMKSKTERWQKISLEAARQSGRGIIPEVCDPVSFEQAVAMSGSADISLFAWEGEKTVTLKQALESKLPEDVKEIAVFVGPEGGYDESEADEATRNGALAVTIGKRILRTETAGAAVLAMLLYHYEL